MNIVHLPSPNRSHRIQGDPIDLIVLHSTVGSFGNSLSWLRSPASGVSTHYLIGIDGMICNLVDETEQAWHAGVSFWRGRTDLNRYSIGIEIANRTGAKGFKGNDPYTEVQLATVAALVQNICARRHIPIDRQHIVMHREIAPRRKSDPCGDWDMDGFMRRLGGTAGALEDDAYYVIPSRVNIRQGPGTNFPIAAQALRGQKLYIDTVVHGEKLMGSDLWCHMRRMPPYQYDLGFIKVELLRHGN